MATLPRSTSIQPHLPQGGFVNEPAVDFKLPENSRKMLAALELVSNQLGREYPLVIADQQIIT